MIQLIGTLALLVFFLIVLWEIAKKEQENTYKNVIEQYVINVWEFNLVVVGALIGSAGAQLNWIFLGVESSLMFSAFLVYEFGDLTPVNNLNLFMLTGVWQVILFGLGVGIGTFF